MIYENERVAKVISKNKIKISFDKEVFTSNSDNEQLNEVINLYENKIPKGWFDYYSIKIRYIDKNLFNKNLPEKNLSKKFYKIILEARSISLSFKEFIGCKINIQKIFRDIKKVIFKGTGNHEQLFFDFLLNKLQKKKVNTILFEKKFSKIINTHLKLLVNLINDDEAFYKQANVISNLIEIEKTQIEEKKSNNSDEKSDNTSQQEESQKKRVPVKTIKQKKSSKIKTPQNIGNSENDKPVMKSDIYKTFTREFDISKKASLLVSFDELNQLRKKFDNESKDYTNLINELVKKLKKLLFAFDSTAWKFSQDEGNFDGSKFAAFIANNNNSSIYKLEKKNIEKNTIVTLLMDNSGSMRGKPIITSAITVEILAKTLEKCNVNVEILGFTTKEWKGGESKKKWEKLNKPNNPGRLNDLLHIIYKDADMSWHNTKRNIGLVLKDGILKENIDGEALIWASERLKIRQEKKKILIVISDGAPVDDSTLSVNKPNILENHLKETVLGIEQENKINLVAIGIGHDVSKYYKKAFTIDSPDKLGDVIIDNLAKNLKE